MYDVSLTDWTAKMQFAGEVETRDQDGIKTTGGFSGMNPNI